MELRVVETLRVIAASQHEDDEQADRERRGDGGAKTRGLRMMAAPSPRAAA